MWMAQVPNCRIGVHATLVTTKSSVSSFDNISTWCEEDWSGWRLLTVQVSWWFFLRNLCAGQNWVSPLVSRSNFENAEWQAWACEWRRFLLDTCSLPLPALHPRYGLVPYNGPRRWEPHLTPSKSNNTIWNHVFSDLHKPNHNFFLHLTNNVTNLIFCWLILCSPQVRVRWAKRSTKHHKQVWPKP